jgi:hypothetical protein
VSCVDLVVERPVGRDPLSNWPLSCTTNHPNISLGINHSTSFSFSRLLTWLLSLWHGRVLPVSPPAVGRGGLLLGRVGHDWVKLRLVSLAAQAD